MVKTSDCSVMSIVAVTLVLASHVCLTEEFFFDKGVVKPSDPYVFYGERIVMNCTLHEITENHDSSQLIFLRYFNDKKGERMNSTIVDNRTIQFSKVAEVGDEGMYYCEREMSPTNEIISGQKVTLEYKPPKLTNDDFSCILFNWGEKMECSWELPFKRIEDVDVTLLWFNGGQGLCPTMNENKTKCTWDNNKDGVVLHTGNWQFQLTLKNIKAGNRTVKSQFTKTMIQYVKPNKVTEFSVTSTGDSHCVLLFWQYDVSYSHRLQKARIRYISKRSEEKIKITENNHDNVTICSLLPYTEYNFTIDIKPAKKGFWSDAEVQTFTTDEDVPTAAPEMHPGFYESVPDSCFEQEKNRTVTVFWKKLPKEQQNGVISGYDIEIRNIDTNTVNTVSVDNGLAISKALVLKCINKYNISVRAKTKIGVSPYLSSVLVVNADNSATIPPKVIVEMQQSDVHESLSSFNVSWSVSPDVDIGKIQNFTIQYCVKSLGRCQEELQSVTVAANRRWHELEDLDEEYLIGVSMDFPTYSCGVSFVNCMYHRDAVPPAPNNVVVQSLKDNSLTVTWGPTNCNDDNPYVVKYTVFWCQVANGECQGTEHKKEIDSSQPLSYDMSNLEKDKKYGVQVQAHSHYQNSIRSKMMVKIPRNGELDTEQIVGIVVGGAFLLLFCIAGCLFCCRLCRDKIHSVNRELDFDIPKVTPTSFMKTDDTADRKSQESNTSTSPDASERKVLMSAYINMNSTQETARQNSEESGIGSMNEDEPQSPRYSPTSLELPPVNEEDASLDKEHPYHGLDLSNDLSNNLSKTEKHNGDDCLTFGSSSLPADGYSKITNEVEMQPLIPSGQSTSSGGPCSHGQSTSSGGPTSNGQSTSSGQHTSSGQPVSREAPASSQTSSGVSTSSERPTSSGSSDMSSYVQAANSGPDVLESDPIHTSPSQDQMVFRATGISGYYRPENLRLDMRADANCSSGTNLSDYVQETSTNTLPDSADISRPTTHTDYIQPQDLPAATATTDCSSADKVEEYVTVDQNSTSSIASGHQGVNHRVTDSLDNGNTSHMDEITFITAPPGGGDNTAAMDEITFITAPPGGGDITANMDEITFITAPPGGGDNTAAMDEITFITAPPGGGDSVDSAEADEPDISAITDDHVSMTNLADSRTTNGYISQNFLQQISISH